MNCLDKPLAKFHGQALLIILWSYMIGGAFLFSWLERETELVGYDNVKQGEEAAIFGINNTIKGIIKYINVHYRNNETYYIWITSELVNLEYLKRMRGAFDNSTYPRNPIHPQYVEAYKGKDNTDFERWCFISSLLFVVTTLTTIGYGHVFPTTDLGRGVLVIYCLLAIPLMSLYLLDISITLSRTIENLYRMYCRSFLRPAMKAFNLLRPLSAASTSTTISICSMSHRSSKITTDSDERIFITSPSKVIKYQCNKVKKRSVHHHGQKPKTENSNDEWYLEKSMDIDDAKRKRKLKPLKHCDTSPLLIPTSNTCQIVVKANHRKRSCNLKIRKASAADEQKNRKQSRLLAPSKKLANNDKPTILVEPALLTVPNFLPTLRLDYMDNYKLSNFRRTSNDTTMGFLLNGEERLSKSFELPKLNVPFYFILAILLAYLLLGTIIFCISEEWSVLQCVYCIIITLTTIGLGDLQPGYKEWTTQKGRIINLVLIFYIIGGLSLMAMTVRMMATNVYLKCMKVVDSAGNLTKMKKCCY